MRPSGSQSLRMHSDNFLRKGHPHTDPPGHFFLTAAAEVSIQPPHRSVPSNDGPPILSLWTTEHLYSHQRMNASDPSARNISCTKGILTALSAAAEVSIQPPHQSVPRNDTPPILSLWTAGHLYGHQRKNASEPSATDWGTGHMLRIAQ